MKKIDIMRRRDESRLSKDEKKTKVVGPVVKEAIEEIEIVKPGVIKKSGQLFPKIKKGGKKWTK